MDKKPYWTFNGSVIKCHLVNEDKANKYNIWQDVKPPSNVYLASVINIRRKKAVYTP